MLEASQAILHFQQDLLRDPSPMEPGWKSPELTRVYCFRACRLIGSAKSLTGIQEIIDLLDNAGYSLRTAHNAEMYYHTTRPLMQMAELFVLHVL